MSLFIIRFSVKSVAHLRGYCPYHSVSCAPERVTRCFPNVRSYFAVTFTLSQKIGSNRHKVPSAVAHESVRFKGSNKWHNIKGTKAAKDSIRSSLFSNIVNRMKIAVILKKSIDPRDNPMLADQMERARRANMPKATIQRCLDRLSSPGTEIDKMYEARGPGGCMLLINTTMEKNQESLVNQNFNSVFRKFPGSRRVRAGEIINAFEHRGKVLVPVDDASGDLDKMEEIAIECSAEEVTLGKDEDDRDVYEFHCPGPDTEHIRSSIEKHSLSVSSFEEYYVPLSVKPLSKEDMDELWRLTEKLSDIEFVTRIYDNAELQE